MPAYAPPETLPDGYYESETRLIALVRELTADDQLSAISFKVQRIDGDYTAYSWGREEPSHDRS